MPPAKARVEDRREDTAARQIDLLVEQAAHHGGGRRRRALLDQCLAQGDGRAQRPLCNPRGASGDRVHVAPAGLHDQRNVEQPSDEADLEMGGARVHHGGRVPLIHVDAYRLASLAEVDDMDLDEAIPDSVTVVEWGAGLVEQLADPNATPRHALLEPAISLRSSTGARLR